MFVKESKSLPSSTSFNMFVACVFLLISASTCTDERDAETPMPCPAVTDENEAPKGRFPYMCSIRNPEHGDHDCGGTLIKPQWLLTAAHCVDSNATDSPGTSPIIYCDIHRRSEYRRSKTYSARVIYVHSQWASDFENGFDIALIELNRAANLPVPRLDTEMSNHGPGTKFTVLGWGYTNTMNCADKLQIGLDLNVQPRNFCNNPRLWAGLITESMICVGLGVLHTAKSDSGGPLLLLHKPRGRFEDGDPSRDVLAGITSFGDDHKSTGNVSKPEVYTSVGFFRDWIDCVIEGNIPKEECLTKPVPDPPSSETSPTLEPPSSEISIAPELSTSDISPDPEPPSSEISIALESSTSEISPVPELSTSETSSDPEPPSSEISTLLEPPLYPTDAEEAFSAFEVEVNNCFELFGDDFKEKDAQKRMRDAIEKDDSVIVKCILEEGLLAANMTYIPPLRFLTRFRTSFLHLAAVHNAKDSTKVLLDHGADAHIRDGQERTPLHTAAEHGSLGVARVLVDASAQLNTRARRGDSPLHFAAYYGYQSIVEFLVKKGADVNYKNDNGETPLHIAAARGFLSIVELLLDNEASKTEDDESGETPFDVICQELDRDTECNEETRAKLEASLNLD